MRTDKKSTWNAVCGSGIRCLFDPLYPGWVKKIKMRIRDVHIPDHVSEGLEKIFWVKILKFLYADPDLGSGIILPWIRDQGWKKFGYWIRDKHPGSATQVECLRYQGKCNKQYTLTVK
jgi:hypothetical protein